MKYPDGSKLLALLKKGEAAGLNYPKIVVRNYDVPLKFYLAKRGYVAIILNDETATYLGKITENGTLWLGNCTRQVTEAVSSILNFINKGGDLGTLGKEQGFCCFCSRTLTNDGSLEHGYGPICAEKYGLPWVGYSTAGEQKIPAQKKIHAPVDPILLMLAKRARDAKRDARRWIARNSPVKEHYIGAAAEAWNAFQITKTIDNERKNDDSL